MSDNPVVLISEWQLYGIPVTITTTTWNKRWIYPWQKKKMISLEGQMLYFFFLSIVSGDDDFLTFSLAEKEDDHLRGADASVSNTRWRRRHSIVVCNILVSQYLQHTMTETSFNSSLRFCYEPRPDDLEQGFKMLLNEANRLITSLCDGSGVNEADSSLCCVVGSEAMFISTKQSDKFALDFTLEACVIWSSIRVHSAVPRALPT